MKRLTVLGAAWLLCGLITTTRAQQPQGKVFVEIKVKTMVGKILTLDAKSGKLTIHIKDLAENITVPGDCKFGDENDGLASLSELRVGEQVVVTATDEQGTLLARRISRLKPKKAKAQK